MKKQRTAAKKALSLLLSLCMVLSLLPVTAFAEDEGGPLGISPTASADASAEANTSTDQRPEGGYDIPMPFGGMVPGDAAITSVWEQDPKTMVSTADGTYDAVMTAHDDTYYVQAGSANRNNGNSPIPPMVFVNKTMNDAFEALYQADNRAVRAVEMDITPSVVGGSDFCFAIYLNYKGPNNGLALIYNTRGGWNWQQYGPTWDGNESYGAISGGPILTPGQTYHVKLEQWGSSTSAPTKYYLYIDGKEVTSGGFTTLSTNNGDSRAIGFKLGTYNNQKSAVTIDNMRYTGQAADTMGYSVTGKVVDTKGAPIENAAVMVNGTSSTTNAEGVYTIDGMKSLVPGEHTLTVYKDGYATKEKKVTVTNADLTGQDIVMELIAVNTAKLSTGDMDVTVDADFPRAIEYIMKGDLTGRLFYGQTSILNTVTINGVDVIPTVESTVSESGDKISYTMSAVDADNAIDCVIHAEIVVAGKTLTFNINSIDNNLDEITYPVESISIPNHSLISVRSSQAGANFIGNRLAANTITSGDFRYSSDEFMSANDQRFIYGFISNDELSAGIASNSEWGTGGAGSNNHRVLANAEDRAVYTSLGLSSSEWYYDRKVSSSDGSAINNAVIPDSEKVVGPTELPLYAKVVITGEENGDGIINWQDAAIIARDTIVHKPFKSEQVPELVTTRIALNFGSQAQNPFLTSLDNVKRVYLNTDGLGQSILLKGYGSEGHDSGHTDYANVGMRMGGVPDMLTMMREGADYGARFGIHVNASEFYPESAPFSDKTVRREDNGSLRYGWNWLDQGVGINGLYDLASGDRAARFNALGDKMEGLLDFIYVDVWGNATSGNTEDAWQTRKLSQELVDNGWRVTTEWAWGMEWESTFQHWVADYTYGDYSYKGKYNSEVERFLLNSYKDTFAADYPRYGGSANAPLLGGAAMQGFEGWQGDGEYNEHIESIFEHQIPSKFLQHYDIMEWVDAAAPVNTPWFSGNSGTDGGTTNWTPEAKITLQSPDRGSTVVVTRGTDPSTATTKDFSYGSDAEKQEYRARTITLDGKVILKGTPVPATNVSGQWGGDTETELLRTLANQQYLIPWYWDTDGNQLAAADEKLYHRNDVGGESTWELPSGWGGLGTVLMYELTDNGRVNETTVPVINGTVTLVANAKTPYIVVKGESNQAPAVVWSTGLHLRDVGFNSTEIEDNWTVNGAGTAVRYLNQNDQSVLKMVGEVSVSQAYNSLVPGQKYVTYVAVDNRSSGKASMTVTDASGKILATNYTEQSIAKNYISGYSIHTGHPIEGSSSKFQNMYVFFTAPADGKATLTLSRGAGEGNSYFDDVRTLETEANNLTFDEAGNLVKFTQDFEHVAQGEYPFVVGPGSGGIQDNYQHLSERHDPYTSAGWNVRKTDDVLSGNWSLKLGDRNGTNNLTFQTIPQNFRFEPNVTYTVSFDYQMGTDKDYEVISGVGEYDSSNYTVVSTLKKAQGTTATCKFTIVGDPTGQTWIGLRRTNALPIAPGAGSNTDIFAGLYDFVLDDLVIERSSSQKGELSKLVATASAMLEADYTGDWAAFTKALATAKTVLNNQKATQAQVDGAVAALKAAIAALTKLNVLISGTITVDGQPAAGVVVEVQNKSWVSQGVKVVTDQDGKYTLPSDGLHIMDYYLKVSTPGCSVQSVPVTGLVGNVSKTVDADLTAWGASYAVNFNDDDVSMIAPLSGSVIRRVETTNAPNLLQRYDGTALWFEYETGERTQNNLVNNEIQMINGTVAFDVTTLWSEDRFGVTLRGIDGDNRIYVGQFTGTNKWGWEHWGENGGGYSASYTGPSLKGGNGYGETRHIEVTLDGKQVTLKVDGYQVFSLPMSNPPAGIGFVGFNNMNTPGAEFLVDNFTVIPSDAPAANTYAVSGGVTGAGSAVADAQVIVMAADGTVVTRTVTGVDGSFKTLPVVDGTYTVKVSAPGYSTKTVEAVVSGGELALSAIALDVDAAQLQALYDANKDKVNDRYTDESWTAFQTALEQAKAALAAPTAKTVAAAYSALNSALSGLKEKAVDKGQLRTSYNTFNAYLSTDYTPESWAPFVAALKAAATVLKDTAATQVQVDSALATLVAAEQALVKVGGSTGGSVGGGSSDSITTETTTNPDGSTTVTVTNKTTGTVTETTTTKDGVKAVTETKKDGTKTVVVTLPTTVTGNVTLPVAAVKNGESITVKTEKKTTVTIPSADTKPGVVAVIVRADGTEEIVRQSITGTNGVTLTLDGSAVVKLVDNSKTFSDVPDRNWAAGAVAFASSRELFQGTGADTFTPNGPMTRAMLMTVLARFDGQDTTTGEAWYSAGMDWAKANDISDGTNPDGSISREQLAVMLYRYAQQSGMNVSTEGMAIGEFDDANGISDWATDAMRWAIAAGIITGKTATTLVPGGTATRAEVATMLMRFTTTLSTQ